MASRIRILRLIEYVGPRAAVEDQVRRSLHGIRDAGSGVVINVTTLGEFAESAEGLLLSAAPIFSAQGEE